MKHLDPVADFEARQRANAADESKRVHTLSIRSLLAGPIDVDGIDLDADVRAVVKRFGVSTDFEVDLEIEQVWMVCEAVRGGTIDVTGKLMDHVQAAFETRLEKIAAEKAARTPYWDWETEEESEY